MGHLFSGFTTSENIKIQNAAIQAQSMVEKAWKDIQAVKKGGNASPQFTKWFGKYDSARVTTVFEKINAIHYAMTASSIKCTKSAAAGHYAAAYRPDEGWSMHKVKDIVKSGGYTVEYTNLFFGNFSEEDGGKHPQALTFIHELSHVVAATDDESYPPDTSQDCYGQKKCKHIATDYPAVAVTNADNYGFYCTEFA
ncbi:M35 family metallo-endopeptidase [uncultured Thalassolituus sp.]|uniref:M35 family metallo-endopeptidase n=1 Tax=uncultured Thalassolituus sp. TaxID=285273 RepID=UPI00261E89CB|nr:M35 family metallo-endopeptidase [uncultured Thalassolituus sp.]